MPESVIDRLSCRHEAVFLFVRSDRYWFDLDAIREPLSRPEALAEGIVFGGKSKHAGRSDGPNRRSGQRPSVYGRTRVETSVSAERGRNPGDLWEIPTVPFAEAHFACMPPALAERCILAGCRPGGTVLDPFCGSGTTGMVGLKHGRRFVGIDLSAKYLDLALRTRLAQSALIGEVADGWAAVHPDQAVP